MKRHILDVRIIKSIDICGCGWHRLGITIHVFQAATVPERRATDTGHGVGNGDTRQAATASERITTDADNGVGDGGILTSCNQSVGCCFYDGITSATRIIITVVSCNLYSRQAATASERTTSDAGHGVADGDALQTATILERRSSDASHGVGDGDPRQAATASERRATDTGHGVGDGDARQATTVLKRRSLDASHGVGDGDVRQTTTALERIISDTGYGVCLSVVDDRFGETTLPAYFEKRPCSFTANSVPLSLQR